MSSSRGKKAAVPTSKKKKGGSSSSGPTAETMMTNYDDPGTVQFLLGGLVCQFSVPEFGTVLGLYTKEIKEENDLHALNCHIHRSSSPCWDPLVPGGATYNPSHSKVSALPPSLSGTYRNDITTSNTPKLIEKKKNEGKGKQKRISAARGF
ncbi:hypothetical protein GOBAR_AA17762 [Gossypium barbadense]|uniref:Uncharacterized protein n=1 Tax=Gossypium barbadense TaxID=3634 RepID=A0A2P5XHV0_GOSBA|nr:hypothetical protein GOBAR_AA17762 [Gossypium barbadense]